MFTNAHPHPVHSTSTGGSISAPLARSQPSVALSEGGLYRSGRPGRSWRRWAVALDVDTDSFYDAADDPFDPTEFIDDDDEF